MQDKFCACLWVLTLTLARVNCFPYKTANKLKTEPENSHQDACQEAPGVEGPCYARIPRYTFQSGQCIKFYYGGAWEMITTSRPFKNVRPSAWYMIINSQ